ncbi:hypothetical protein Goari_012436, partial [Gossypium aridum]|nr:hypothetical protein [Gossypium aridum]
GCRLDRTLIRALVKKWRSGTHTFNLLCSECTIILEDVALQFDLLVDGSVVMGSIVVGGWSGICEQLLGNVSNKFFGS